MNIPLTVFFSSVGVSLAAVVFILWSQRLCVEDSSGQHRRFGPQKGGQVVARKQGADARVVQNMLREVESRLRKIRHMPDGEERRYRSPPSRHPTAHQEHAWAGGMACREHVDRLW
uniref:Uncharacterized protein n=1 Tax=Tetraselmis sp. GSL018 TaxID=582737 RepID=A0A061RE33_9CHLO